MKQSHPVNCLICKSEKYKVVFSYTKPDEYERTAGVSGKGYFRKWVRCGQCGFYYSIYSRDPKAMDGMYGSDAYREEGQSWRKEGSAEEVFRKVIALPESESVTKRRIKWIKENLEDLWEGGLVKKGKARPYRMLDVGGGTGVFAYEFQDKDWKSSIIDPDKNSSFIQNKFKIPLVQDFYKPSRFSYKFDLVSSIYTLEHVLNPALVLKGIQKDLKKYGLLFIEVPDAIYFRYKSATDDIFHSEHLWMFSPNTLNMFLESCGYEMFCVKRLLTKRNHFALMALAGKKI